MIFINKGKEMTVTELKKQMGIGTVLHEHKRFEQHPKNNDDMCWVVGISNSPIPYSKVKELGISEDKISYFEDYITWLENRNTYLEEQARIRREKDNIQLPF